MKTNRKIRVLVVDDSMLFREVLVQGLSKDAGIEVVGVAADAYMARDKIIDLQPDVMTLDIEMPRMSGVEFLKKLMPQYPLPVVVVSGLDEHIFDALNAGAVDFVCKPDVLRHENTETFINEMITKIKIASTAKVGRLKREMIQEAAEDGPRYEDMIIAIGASTGGTEATLELLRNLPREVPGIVIVQHMPPVFTKMYAERLDNLCKLDVREAKDGDLISPGIALVAPGGLQLRVVRGKNGYRVRLSEEEKHNGHCPSVDVMFNSVATAAKSNALGIILTGMGSDGAYGLLNMREHGAYTLGQDEKSCVVYGMPKVAWNIGAVSKQCSPGQMPEEILKELGKRHGG